MKNHTKKEITEAFKPLFECISAEAVEGMKESGANEDCIIDQMRMVHATLRMMKNIISEQGYELRALVESSTKVLAEAERLKVELNKFSRK
tara:strand:- start:303 stop:575 length:273 start_codon:yes stop_codon:yes gene_type:complete